MVIDLGKPKWTARQQMVLEVAEKQGFIHRNQIYAIIIHQQYANSIIDSFIEYGYLIPDKQSIFIKKYKNGRINEVCQRYLYNNPENK